MTSSANTQATTQANTQTTTDGRTLWKIDPTHTTVEFSAKHLMITSVKGRFSDVEGNIYTDEQNPANSSVEATLKTASIDTRMDQRDAHLRSGDFLDVENFPTITFKSTHIEGDKNEFKLTGDMTIRGTTKPITFNVTFEGEGRDPWAVSGPVSAHQARSTAVILDSPGTRHSKRAESWSATISSSRSTSKPCAPPKELRHA